MPPPSRRSAPAPSRHRPMATALPSGTAATAAAARSPAPAPSGGPVDSVALGDSFSSGPDTPEQADEACGRSSRNHPALVTASHAATSFTDVACAGADTRHTTVPQGAAAPQLDALRPDTTLVTLGIGGNDLDLAGVHTRRVLPGKPAPLGTPRKRSCTLPDVDAYAPSVGHDACVPQGVRWIEPAQTAGAAGFHPNAAAHRSTTDAALATLTR